MSTGEIWKVKVPLAEWKEKEELLPSYLVKLGKIFASTTWGTSSVIKNRMISSAVPLGAVVLVAFTDWTTGAPGFMT